MHVFLALVVLCLGTGSAAYAENYLVLPFFNVSGNANLNWVGESLPENIREVLAAEGVLTLERENRQEAYRRLSLRPYSTLTKASVIRVAESLDSDQVIYGSFELLPPEKSSKSKGTLRVVAQIVNLRKALRGPEFTERSALEDLAVLQTHLAWQTLQFVTPSTAPSEEEFRKQRPILRVDAIESYIRGLLAPTTEQKLKLFTQAGRLEPRYSQANFQLGRLHWQNKSYRQAADFLQRVTPGDMHFREATFLLGVCRFRIGDYPTAERAFRSVALSVPLNEVWNNLGAAQSRQNSPEALESFRKALEGDSTDPDYQFNVGLVLYRKGDLEGAAERFRAVLERNPDDTQATNLLARSTQSTGARIPGLEAMERVKETYEESAYWQLKAVLERKR